MKFLGLDLSLTSTGYSYDDNCEIISVNSTGAKRLIEISESIGNLIVEFKIQAAIIEGYAFSSRKSQAHSIGELGGVVRVMLHRMEIPFVEIPPTCRAKFATGKGNASKFRLPCVSGGAMVCPSTKEAPRWTTRHRATSQKHADCRPLLQQSSPNRGRVVQPGKTRTGITSHLNLCA